MPLTRTSKIDEVSVPGDGQGDPFEKQSIPPALMKRAGSSWQRLPSSQLETEQLHTVFIAHRLCVAVVGEPAVGKTALLQMLDSRGSRFPQQYLMTCGVELFIKAMPNGNKGSVELHLLDCGGQDTFTELVAKHWQACAVSSVVLVYDVTRPHTLEATSTWYQRLCDALGKESLPGALLASKTDQRERVCVSRAVGEQFAQRLQMSHFEASAVTYDGVEEPFKHLAAAAAAGCQVVR
mmetsp:Transcript_23859/g.39451  ORF Transcript_23859/g.39451 Transcript_23859/m.39451 type:complete len:237 (-) Transcript_23859:455-1165(-)